MVFQLIAYLLSPSRQQRKHAAEVAAMREQLATISMASDYTAYVKLERRIAAAEREQGASASQQLTRTLVTRYGLSYGSQALLSLILFGMSLWYRSVPVLVLGDRFNFAPFAWLMRFPTGVEGAVSVPFWVFVSSFVAKGVASVCGH